MIDTIARLGVVLLLVSATAAADPVTLGRGGSTWGPEPVGTHGLAYWTVLNRHRAPRFVEDCRDGSPAWNTSQGVNLCALICPSAADRGAAPPSADLDSPPALFPAPLFPEDTLFPDPLTGMDDPNSTVDFTPNPEPGSLLLAGAGLLALYLLRRRRQ